MQMYLHAEPFQKYVLKRQGYLVNFTMAILHKIHSKFIGEYINLIFGTVRKKWGHPSLSSHLSSMFQPCSHHGHGEAGCVKSKALYLLSEGKCHCKSASLPCVSWSRVFYCWSLFEMLHQPHWFHWMNKSQSCVWETVGREKENKEVHPWWHSFSLSLANHRWAAAFFWITWAGHSGR